MRRRGAPPNAQPRRRSPLSACLVSRRLEAEGRILHRDWERCDTGHVVFRPRGMSAEELERGYEWIYQRLFSMRSIWARRPR